MKEFEDFIKAIKVEDIKRVKELFQKKFIKEREGYRSALHIASKYNNKGEIVKYLLSEGFNIEDEDTITGERSAHIAAGEGKVEVLKTLLEEGCCFESLDKYGQCALDLATMNERKQCVDIIGKTMIKNKDFKTLSKESLAKIMDPKSRKTLLDKFLSYNDPKILNKIKTRAVNYKDIKEWKDLDLERVDPQSYTLLQECLLARCFYHKYEDGVYMLCSAEIVNKDSLFMGPSTLETAISCKVSMLTLNLILKKVLKINESWAQTENIAKIKNQEELLTLISQRRQYLTELEKNGFSRLLVAVIENDPDMIEYIMKSQSGNMNLKKEGGLALNLSYNIGHIECVKSLQNNNVCVSIVDRFNETPLSKAIYNRIEDLSAYLVDNTFNIEAENIMNFTLLEQSVMRDCEKICGRLIKKGALCTKIVKIDPQRFSEASDLGMILHNTPLLSLTKSETIYTLCFKVNHFIYPCLLEVMDSNIINSPDEDGNSLLHLCAASMKPDICSQLILKNANLNCKNKNNMTPLMECLKRNLNEDIKKIPEYLFNTVHVLLNAGASLNARQVNEHNLLELAVTFEEEKLFLSLLSKKEPLENIKKEQWLGWLFKKQYFPIRKIIGMVQKPLLEDFITIEGIKYVLEDDLVLATQLYDNASYDVQKKVIENILLKVAKEDDIALFSEMIENEVSSTALLEKEERLFNYLIKERKKLFIDKLLNSRNASTWLSIEDAEKKVALHVCIECEYWDIIYQLITDSNSQNNEDINGNSPLSLLFTKMSETEEEQKISQLMVFVKILILKMADIFKMNNQNKNVITYCSKSGLRREIETFFEKNYQFYDKVEFIKMSESIYAELTEEVGPSVHSPSHDILPTLDNAQVNEDDDDDFLQLQSAPSDNFEPISFQLN